MTTELFREDAYLKTCDAMIVSIGDDGVVLNRTVFYPEGGGQPGDVGTLTLSDGAIVSVVDTRKAAGGNDVVHVLNEGAGSLEQGQTVIATIDWDRRYKHMRMHTCMHLLCSLIEGGVTGGSVGETKSRLDFDLPDTSLDKERITADLNRLVEQDHAVSASWITDEEMSQREDLVRTMSVKPPMGKGRVRLMEIAGVDLQPCGGTHVKSTGEIGRVRIGKIENKGKHNRRVNILFDE